MPIIPLCLNIHVAMTEVISCQQHISPIQNIKPHIQPSIHTCRAEILSHHTHYFKRDYVLY